MKLFAFCGALALTLGLAAVIAFAPDTASAFTFAGSGDLYAAMALPAGVTFKRSMPTVSLPALLAGRPAAVAGHVRGESNPGNLEQLLKDVKSELDKVGSAVKKTAEDALKQSKDAGTATDEVKATADELLISQKKLSDAQDKIEAKLELLETRNTDIEQLIANFGKNGGAQQAKTIGQEFASSEEVKAFINNGCKGSARLTYKVENAITSVKPGGGGLIWSERESEIVGLPKRRMTIRNLLMQGRTGSNSIDYAKQTVRTNNAAMVSETVQKPESDYKYDQATVNVRTIAHWVHVSRQAMEDAAQLQTEIDGELRYGLALKEETQLLKGDGTGQNLSGLVTEADAFSAAFTVSGGNTMIDTLRLAILQVALNEYPANGIVLHPTDWARIELLKDGEQRYLFASIVQMAGPQLWGLPVVDTQSMDEDEFLVGAFNMAGTIYDRMDPEVLASSEDRDNFIKNMITVRAEERLALAVKRPSSMTTGDFGNVSG